MNDPLKKYIDHHRDEFDHLNPSADLFSKINLGLQSKPVVKPTFSLTTPTKWMAAASIVIVLTATLLLVKNNSKPHLAGGQTAKNQQKAVQKPIDLSTDVKNPVVNVAVHPTKQTTRKHKTQINQTNLSNFYADLADSTSSNTRLSAILEIQRSKVISYDVVDRLTKILNRDSNSNVRLAALNVLSQYANDQYVANNLIHALSGQTDPLVQIGLMDLLKNIDNPTLDGRLYALANDPNTLSAVKDQAYFILMNQNKL